MNKDTLMKESFPEREPKKPPDWSSGASASSSQLVELLQFQTELSCDCKCNSQKIDHNHLIADF